MFVEARVLPAPRWRKGTFLFGIDEDFGITQIRLGPGSRKNDSCCGRPCNRRVKVIRPDTARHPALTLTLHRRPQPRTNSGPVPPVMNSLASPGGWLTKIDRCSVANRSATVPERFFMNVKFQPQRMNVNLSDLNQKSGGLHQCLRQVKQHVSSARPCCKHCRRQRQPE